MRRRVGARERLGQALARPGCRFLDAQKKAHAERQARAAEAKAEEAAFLAELEADEEELLEAEREVDEAEAMAEEALRLARVTEQH